MFTGIIETTGKVAAVRPVGGSGLRVTIDLGGLVSKVHAGDSVAVNGICLTAAAFNGSLVDFDVSGETVAKSTIKSLKVASQVNLELAMAADGRFGGHIVQGHVDGIARVKSIANRGQFYEVWFSVNPDLRRGLISKGSVAVNGISLTVADLDKDSFSVAVIPVTWQETVLKNAKPGDEVNIETDIVVKVINQRLDEMASGGAMTIEKLRGMGF